VNLLLLWLSPLGTVVTRLQAELPTEKDECIELKKHLEDLGDHVHGESRNEGGREGGRAGGSGRVLSVTVKGQQMY